MTELDRFYADLTAADLYPLWTITDELLTATPQPRAVPWLWPAKTLRELADRALRLIPVERGGERRVLSLGNPGLAGVPYAAGTLWGAVQCLRPNELAPAHRHSPGAIRFVLEGDGVWTTVNGDACDMRAGDLVLTPSWNWHEHTGNDSGMLWFDGLDLPMVQSLDAIFFEPYPELRQPAPEAHNVSLVRYGERRRFVTGAVTEALHPDHSPLLVYPWVDTDAELARLLAEDDGAPMVSLEFVNPLNGASVLPTLACAMHRLRPGATTLPVQRAGNTIFVVYAGSGVSVIDGLRFEWSAGDIFVVPSWSAVEHHADGPSDLFTLADTPVLRALGLYREKHHDEPQGVRGTFAGRTTGEV